MSNIKIVTYDPSAAFMVDQFMNIAPVDDGAFGGGFSVVRGTLKGVHSRRVNRRSTKSYYILAGQVAFFTEDGNYSCGPHEFAIVKPNVEVEVVSENCEMLILCSPPFDFSDETEI